MHGICPKMKIALFFVSVLLFLSTLFLLSLIEGEYYSWKGILHVVLQLLWKKSRAEINPRRDYRLKRIQKAFKNTNKCFSLLHQIFERFIECDQAVSWSCRNCSWNWYNCNSWLRRVSVYFSCQVHLKILLFKKII